MKFQFDQNKKNNGIVTKSVSSPNNVPSKSVSKPTLKTASIVSKKEHSSGGNLKVASVIGGLAAAAAIGGYFLYQNKDAQKKIKSIKGWVLKAKGEVLEKIENLKEVNQEAYQKAVDMVLVKYEKLSHIDSGDVAKVSKELKSHWKAIQAELEEGSKKVARVIKAAAKAGVTAASVPSTSTKVTVAQTQNKKPISGMKKA